MFAQRVQQQQQQREQENGSNMQPQIECFYCININKLECQRARALAADSLVGQQQQQQQQHNNSMQKLARQQ